MKFHSTILIGVLSAAASVGVASPALAAGDSLSPAVIVIDATPAITSPTSGSFVWLPAPEIRGTAPAGSVVTLFLNGLVDGNATAATDGTWSYVPEFPLFDGTYDAVAVAEDVGTGEVSAPSPTVTFTVDTAAPARPVITSPASGQDVSDPRPTFTGTSEPGATIDVSLDGVVTGSTLVTDAGSWSFTPEAALKNGTRQLTVRAKDRAGNQSLSRSVSFDVLVPANAPQITSPSDATATDSTTVAVDGIADAGCAVTVRIDGSEWATVVADDVGFWTVSVTGLALGTHVIDAVCANPSGSVSSPSAPVSVIVEEATDVPGEVTPTPTPTPAPPVVDPIDPEPTVDEPSVDESTTGDVEDGTVGSEFAGSRNDAERAGAAQSLAHTGGSVPTPAILGGAFALACGVLLALLGRRRKASAEA